MNAIDPKDAKATKATKKTSTRRKLAIAGGAATGLVTVLWGAIHLGFGPALADGARAVIGPGPVAWAEDVVYGLEDRVKRVVYQDAAPKQYWDETPAPVVTPSPEQPIASEAPVAPAFRPANFAPPVEKVALPTDGKWITIADPAAPDGPPLMYKALVHPDGKRSFAAVAVVAIDLTRLNLTLVAGTVEPASTTVPRADRPGIVPADQFDELVAAFNGGFKAEHGHYGMMLNGQTFVPPRDIACTLALYPGGGARIGTWTAVKDTEGAMAAYRQTPPCLVEQGKVNDQLVAVDDSHNWGAAVGGETAIRRSAVGLDPTGNILFFAIGDSMTAGALARAMKAAGAENAAQLDVNAAYPRFFFFSHPKSQPPRVSGALIPVERSPEHAYTGEAEGRDFFYLTRKRLAS